MADRPISPQGYDITKDPKNYNPFWSEGDEPVDPSVYIRLDQLEEDVEDLETTKADKTEIPDLTNYYNKAQTDALLNNKADTTDLPDMTNYYTKTQTNTLLNGKADQATTYTKTEVDNQLATKINIGALNAYYNKTDIDNMLTNYVETDDLTAYYTKTQVDALFNNYYTKAQIDATLGDIQSLLEVI